MYKFLLISFSFFQFFSANAQGFSSYTETEKDSLLNIDYINKDYRFLDENFQIKTDELKAYQASPDMLKFRENAAYKDSLRVILKYNLKHDYAVHLAYHRILTPWERTSFYLWKNVDEAQELAKSFGFKHPYLFYEFLISEEPHPQKEKVLNNLEAKLKSSLDQVQAFKTHKELLHFAFKHNPERKKAMNAYFKRKNMKHRH